MYVAEDRWIMPERAAAGAQTPEQRLCLELLAGAVRDIRTYPPGSPVYAYAELWLRGAEAPIPFSDVCTILGACPEAIRDSLLHKGRLMQLSICKPTRNSVRKVRLNRVGSRRKMAYGW